MQIRAEWKWLVVIAAACVAVFANALSGEFVYDDLRQIVRNPLIQDSSYFWTAVTSDVWAFKGVGTVAASNYWRPTFTLWNIINFRLFGLDPFGWHLTNLFLHTGVCLTAFILLRTWAFSAPVAFTITLLFAVHPVHVESVAWIGGSPDLLFSLFFLGSLWFATNYLNSDSTLDLALAVGLFAVAIGAKELGLVCLPIYYLLSSNSEADRPRSNAKMLLGLIAAVSFIYFLLRWSVIGAIVHSGSAGAASPGSILSIPSAFALYLRQALFPYWLGANYQLPNVDHIGFENLILPVVVSAICIASIVYLARTTHKGKLAAAIFFLPLAMSAAIVVKEQAIRDRYLYLPLLGLLMLLVSFATRYLTEARVVAAGVTLASLLAVQTVSYNRAWASDLALWSRTMTVDDSALTRVQYASELLEAKRYNEAIETISPVIERRPEPRAYLIRGRAFIFSGSFEEAEADLRAALALPIEVHDVYGLYQIYEALGLSYSRSGKLEAALRNFEEARERLPMYYAALTVNLAIVLYQLGQKERALAELETAQAKARRELLPESKDVFLRLGMLYSELGRPADARKALEEYLRQTAEAKDTNTLDGRKQARTFLSGH